VASVVARYLHSLPPTMTEVSSRVVKKNARGDDGVTGCLLAVPFSTYRDGVKKLSQFTTTWALNPDGRGFVREKGCSS